MRKTIAVIICFMIVFTLNTSFAFTSKDNSFSSNNSSETLQETDSSADSGSNVTYMFRSIPWMSDFEFTKVFLDKEDDIVPKERSISENASIPDWNDADDSIHLTNENSGVVLYYTANVAGYQADLIVAFVYPLSEGWTVTRETSAALFCEATYILKGIKDYNAAYKDLLEKLSSLYGTSYEPRSDINLITGTKKEEGVTWKGNDGSIIYLKKELNILIGGTEGVVLTYAAPNTNSILYEVSNAEELKRQQEENESREENTTNLNGL